MTWNGESAGFRICGTLIWTVVRGVICPPRIPLTDWRHAPCTRDMKSLSYLKILIAFYFCQYELFSLIPTPPTMLLLKSSISECNEPPYLYCTTTRWSRAAMGGGRKWERGAGAGVLCTRGRNSLRGFKIHSNIESLRCPYFSYIKIWWEFHPEEWSV